MPKGAPSSAGDYAEDAISGLEEAAKLVWKSTSRVLVHIADAPCHGKEFNDMGDRNDDYWEKGDKHGREVAAILTKLRVDAQVDTYLFCHLTTFTHMMTARFEQLAGKHSYAPCSLSVLSVCAEIKGWKIKSIHSYLLFFSISLTFGCFFIRISNLIIYIITFWGWLWEWNM